MVVSITDPTDVLVKYSIAVRIPHFIDESCSFYRTFFELCTVPALSFEDSLRA